MALFFSGSILSTITLNCASLSRIVNLSMILRSSFLVTLPSRFYTGQRIEYTNSFEGKTMNIAPNSLLWRESLFNRDIQYYSMWREDFSCPWSYVAPSLWQYRHGSTQDRESQTDTNSFEGKQNPQKMNIAPTRLLCIHSFESHFKRDIQYHSVWREQVWGI